MKFILPINEYFSMFPNDSIGYDIGEYIYHVTPIKNVSKIERSGFKPKDGISINKKPFMNRLYFATSLISAYDLSVNFGSDNNLSYVIFKVDSSCINEYEEDPLFGHGIYIDYPISNKFIVDKINADDLFDKYDDDDIENLY